MFKVLLCVLLISSIDSSYGLDEDGTNSSLPVVMWHGMGKKNPLK